MFLSKILMVSCMIMDDHTLRCRRKYFCRYFLQVYVTEEILTSNIKDCFKINGKHRIKMPKKGEFVTLKIYEGKKVTIYNLCRF